MCVIFYPLVSVNYFLFLDLSQLIKKTQHPFLSGMSLFSLFSLSRTSIIIALFCLVCLIRSDLNSVHLSVVFHSIYFSTHIFNSLYLVYLISLNTSNITIGSSLSFSVPSWASPVIVSWESLPPSKKLLYLFKSPLWAHQSKNSKGTREGFLPPSLLPWLPRIKPLGCLVHLPPPHLVGFLEQVESCLNSWGIFGVL